MHPLALAFGFGCAWLLGNGQVQRFERLAAADLRSVLGSPEARVAVQVKPSSPLGAALGDLRLATIRASGFSTNGLPLFTEPKRSRKGVVRELRIELSSFRLCGLEVERLEASIPRCRYDIGLALSEHRFRLSRSGTGTGYVAVREAALGDFVLRKFREISSVQVRIHNDHVFVEGEGEFLIAKARFFVVGKLSVQEGTKLYLSDVKILLNGARAEGAVRESMLSILNPVVDLDKDLRLHGAIQVERMKLRNGLLEAWGPATVPPMPEAPVSGHHDR